MRRATLFAILFAMQGCAAADGYRLERVEVERAEIHVRFVDYRDRAELLRAADAIGAQAGEHRALEAFAEVKGDACIIHSIDPRRVYRPAWIGHEITHCRFGRFHK